MSVCNLTLKAGASFGTDVRPLWDDVGPLGWLAMFILWDGDVHPLGW